MFLPLIVMSTFLSRSQSPCYFLPIYGDQVFVLLQVKYPGNGLQKQPFMLSAPWEGYITEIPILWVQLLTFSPFCLAWVWDHPIILPPGVICCFWKKCSLLMNISLHINVMLKRFLFLEKWPRAPNFSNLLHYRRRTNYKTCQSSDQNTQSSQHIPEGRCKRVLERDFITHRETHSWKVCFRMWNLVLITCKNTDSSLPKTVLDM